MVRMSDGDGSSHGRSIDPDGTSTCVLSEEHSCYDGYELPRVSVCAVGSHLCVRRV